MKKVLFWSSIINLTWTFRYNRDVIRLTRDMYLFPGEETLWGSRMRYFSFHYDKELQFMFFRHLEHTDGRLTNSNLFRTCQPILIEITMVVYEKIYLAA